MQGHSVTFRGVRKDDPEGIGTPDIIIEGHDLGTAIIGTIKGNFSAIMSPMPAEAGLLYVEAARLILRARAIEDAAAD